MDAAAFKLCGAKLQTCGSTMENMSTSMQTYVRINCIQESFRGHYTQQRYVES